MSKPRTATPQSATLNIAQDQWIEFLANFTRDYRGAHARLEVIGSDTYTGYRVETEDRTFDGVAADDKDGEHNVWITFGGTPADHITHGVHRVTAIRTLLPTSNTGPVLDIEAKDGTKTLLMLSRPEDYALPPAAPERSRS